jgi:hypothetical protein
VVFSAVVARALLPFLAVSVLVGCASEASEREFHEKLPPPPMWRGPHPVGGVYGAVSDGNVSYTTSGTGANVRDKTDARLYRVAYLGRAGFMFDWLQSDGDLAGNAKLEGYDLFGFANLPLWPNDRLRFTARPGLYYNRINLKNAGPADVEPWTFGLRYELEAGVDVVKKPQVVFSLYASGRFGWGTGEATVGTSRESVDAFLWGWEAGARLHYRRFFLGLSWIDRNNEVNGFYRFVEADYRYEGANLSFGLRW